MAPHPQPSCRVSFRSPLQAAGPVCARKWKDYIIPKSGKSLLKAIFEHGQRNGLRAAHPAAATQRNGTAWGGGKCETRNGPAEAQTDGDKGAQSSAPHPARQAAGTREHCTQAASPQPRLFIKQDQVSKINYKVDGHLQTWVHTSHNTAATGTYQA